MGGKVDVEGEILVVDPVVKVVCEVVVVVVVGRGDLFLKCLEDPQSLETPLCRRLSPT